jgi:Tol biopolymer transport system component/tRNA A-37 threonylcarbamoyl transferase component Bud32
MSNRIEDLRAALAGRYEIDRQIGQGGMATVYLADDVRHQRKVAVKVLRSDLAAALGGERFLREIRIAANLTHPHILPLHDSGEADGFLYYVMPNIEGDTLRERLEKEGELPVGEAVRIIREVVDALAFAHSKGVVHRDIKPDNVMLSGGHAMVMDFGVAKAVSEATGRDKITTAGVALGTPAYMSPEQATADQHVDHRSDIYAVGAMAYELLAGRPPFTAATPQGVLAAQVTQAPDPVSKYRDQVSPELEAVVMRCLAKRPADRWQSSAELLPHLDTMTTSSGGLTPTGMTPLPAQSSSGGRRVWWMAAGAAAAVVVIAVFGATMMRDDPLVITTSNIRQITRAVEPEMFVALSPDGKVVAYRSGHRDDTHIEVRDVSGGRPLALTGDWGGQQDRPTWMPDDGSVGFRNRRSSDGHDIGRWKLPRMGGQAERPDSADRVALRGGWEMAFPGDSVYLMDPATGDTVLRMFNAPQSTIARARWRADGGAFAYTVGNSDYYSGDGNIAPSEIWVAPIGGTPVRVSDSTSLNMSPAWLPDGTLLFVSNREGPKDIYAVRLDDDGVPREAAVRFTTGLEPYTISVSADGSALAYDRFTHRQNIYAIPAPASGSVSVRDARPVTTANQIIESLSISTDGQWLTFDSNMEGNQDIFVMPVAGGEPRRVTRDPGDDFMPDFSPDAREITFHSSRNATREIYVIDADGSAEQRLTTDGGQNMNPAFSPTGLAIAYAVRTSRGVLVLRRETLDAPWQAPEPLQIQGWGLRWSPDGSSLVYHRAGGTSGIEVFEEDGSPIHIITSGTAGLTFLAWPEWSADGSTIYLYATGPDDVYGLYSVSASGGEPRLLVRFDEPSMQVSPLGGVVESDGMFYFTIGEFESDIYVMDLEY